MLTLICTLLRTTIPVFACTSASISVTEKPGKAIAIRKASIDIGRRRIKAAAFNARTCLIHKCFTAIRVVAGLRAAYADVSDKRENEGESVLEHSETMVSGMAGVAMNTYSFWKSEGEV